VSTLVQRTTTGDFATGVRFLKSAYLAAGSTNSSAELKDGAGGTVLLKLTAIANGDGAYWAAGDKPGVQFSSAITLHSIARTGAAVTCEFT
jgi:hypothetical protein